jgi:group I intron endonuclease
MAFIYKITNLLNNKFYIGFTNMTLKKRFSNHKSNARKLSNNMIIGRAIRKYGEENFIIEEICNHPDPEYCLKVLEPKFIKELQPEYNSTLGGEGIIGFHHSQKTKDENSKRTLGRILTTQHKEQIGKTNSHPFNENHIQNMKLKGNITCIDTLTFISKNDAALYATQTYHMSRNTAIRNIDKGITDFSIFKNKYHNKNPYTAKKLEKWRLYQ